MLKKLVALLAGKEYMPDPKAASEKFREESQREGDLAREKEEHQKEAMREKDKEKQKEDAEVEVDLTELEK